MVGASRSAVQDLCASVFRIALSQGVIQKMVERVSKAIGPHDTAIGEVARTSWSITLTRRRGSCTVSGTGYGGWPTPRWRTFRDTPIVPKPCLRSSSRTGEGSGSVMAMGSISPGKACGKAAWRICSARPKDWQSGWTRASLALGGGARRAPTALSYGHRATHGRAVAGVVCALHALLTPHATREDKAGTFARRLRGQGRHCGHCWMSTG